MRPLLAALLLSCCSLFLSRLNAPLLLQWFPALAAIALLLRRSAGNLPGAAHTDTRTFFAATAGIAVVLLLVWFRLPLLSASLGLLLIAVPLGAQQIEAGGRGATDGNALSQGLLLLLFFSCAHPADAVPLARFLAPPVTGMHIEAATSETVALIAYSLFAARSLVLSRRPLVSAVLLALLAATVALPLPVALTLFASLLVFFRTSPRAWRHKPYPEEVGMLQ